MKNITPISICMFAATSLVGGETPEIPQPIVQVAHDAPLTYRVVDRRSLGIVIPNPLNMIGFIDRTAEGSFTLGAAYLTDYQLEQYEFYKNNQEKFQDKFQRSHAPKYYAHQDLVKENEMSISKLQTARPPQYRLWKYYRWNSKLQAMQKLISEQRTKHDKVKKELGQELKDAQDKYLALKKALDSADIMPWKNFAEQLPQQADLLKSTLHQLKVTKNPELRLVKIFPSNVENFNLIRGVNAAEKETWSNATNTMSQLISKHQKERGHHDGQQEGNVLMVRPDITHDELLATIESAEQDQEVQKLLQNCGKILLRNSVTDAIQEQENKKIRASAAAYALMLMFAPMIRLGILR